MDARPRFARWLLAICAALLLAVVWFVTRSAPPDPVAPGASAVTPTPAASSPVEQAVDRPAESVVPQRAIAATPAADAPAATSSAKSKRTQTLVYGSLLDSVTGEPIRGAWSAGVSLSDSTGRRRHSDAKDEGAYALHALPFGTYWMTAGAHGYRGVEAQLDLGPDAPVVQRDFTLTKAAVIKVKVVDAQGKPMAGEGAARPLGSVLPVATREPPGDRFFEVTGSLNNSFGIGSFWNYGPPVEGLGPGYLGVVVLRGELPAYVSLVHYHVVLETRRVEPGTDEVVFVLSEDALRASLATIRLRVVDAETDAGIAGVHAMLSGGPGMRPTPGSDAKGTLAIEGCEPGKYDLRVIAKGYESLRIPVIAEPGQITDLGDVMLAKELRVEGRIVDGEGRGVATAFSLGVLDPATRKIDMDRTMGHASDATGAFTLTGLGRRQYVLRTDNLDALNDKDRDDVVWVSGNVFVDTRAGPITGLEIALHPATLVVLRVGGEPADGLRFRVEDADRNVVVASRFYGPGPRPLRLPAGAYRVALLDAAGVVLAEKSVTVGAQTTEVELAR